MKFMDRFRKQKITEDTPDVGEDEVSPVGQPSPHHNHMQDDVERPPSRQIEKTRHITAQRRNTCLGHQKERKKYREHCIKNNGQNNV